MRVPPIRCAVAAVMLAVLGVGAAAQPEHEQTPQMRDAVNARNLAMGVHLYAQKNEGKLPPDLAALLPYVTREGEGTAESIRKHMMAPGIPGPEVPNDAKAAWVNENSSYAYLGRSDLGLKDLPWFGDLAIAHLKLDRGHAGTPDEENPDGEWVSVAFLDGHCATMTKASARALIEESKAVIEAVATGGPLPDVYQIEHDLRLIGEAVGAYAKERDGLLPPDFGAMLAHVPVTRRTQTLAQRAAVFVPPRVRRNLHVPEAADAEWVNRHAGYAYLGGGGVKLAEVDGLAGVALMYVKPEDVVKAPGQGHAPHGGADRYLVAGVPGWVQRGTRAYYDWVIAHSKRVFEAARGNGPWPDLPHAQRDLRLLNEAIRAYAKAHDQMCPPDLGATFEFLPGEAGATPAERARVYLTPRAERVVTPPDDADGDWVKGHASYVYLGVGDLSLAWARRGGGRVLVLLHAPLGEEYVMFDRDDEEPHRVTPLLHGSTAWPMRVSFVEQVLEESRAEIAKGKGKK